MRADETRALLTAVAAGEVAPEEALDRLTLAPYVDLGHSLVDLHRGLRTGDPEVVYGAGKTTRQVLDVVAALAPDGPVLVTRVDPATAAALAKAHPCEVAPGPGGATVAVDPPPADAGVGLVAVVAAGTSDGPVAAEAALTARLHGARVTRVDDVGVAGMHRLLAAREALDAADCLVVVAGMEGALPSVVGGLVGTPLVAVPTSVGYGASYGGLAALLAMLSSCAPGISVVNVDNGYGAGVFAARVARAVGRARG